jgi:chromosome segregation ATPase
MPDMTDEEREWRIARHFGEVDGIEVNGVPYIPNPYGVDGVVMRKSLHDEYVADTDEHTDTLIARIAELEAERKRRQEIDDEAFEYAEQVENLKAELEAERKSSADVMAELKEFQAWSRVAAKANRELDAYLRKVHPSLPKHYGMPVDGVRTVIEAEREAVRELVKAATTNAKEDWGYNDVTGMCYCCSCGKERLHTKPEEPESHEDSCLYSLAARHLKRIGGGE